MWNKLNDTKVIKISFPTAYHTRTTSPTFLKLVAMPSLLDKDNELVSGSLLVPTNNPAAALRPFLIDELSW